MLFTIDAVLTVRATRKRSTGASLLTHYTFGVGYQGVLLAPIAKAYAGLSNDENAEGDCWIKGGTHGNALDQSGMSSRSTYSSWGFEAIARSTRHRFGIAVRFPRMLKWRTDKKAEDADTLETVQKLLDA